ncbi:unnamed protein product [Mytilus coruscus]|uniref:Uncharacterized protein n=1 Tax=Mytilus coruscus TaxID=42192 RepID=A0A6J8DL84_MYTCO|nr:unnamed protein product [Mytilus coruscus]
MTMEASTVVKKKKPSSKLEDASQIQAAINSICKSQYGYAIRNKNPFDDKQLEKKLEKLDKEQKLRASEMFWKQRQFFIEKAFDDNNELRFAKLRKEKESLRKEKTFSLPEIPSSSNTPTSNSRSSGQSNANKGDKITIASALFPKIVETIRPKSNKSKKVLKKQRILIELQERSNLIQSPVLSESPITRYRSANEEVKPNPILIPVETNTEAKQKNSDIEKCKDTKQLTDKYDDGRNKRNRKKKKTEANELSLLTTADNNNESYANDNEHISMPVRDNVKLADLDENAHSMLMKIIGEANTSVTDDLKIELSKMNDYEQRRNSTIKLLNSTEKLSTDELLLKLTMSLPMRLLLKTDQTLNDLSSALGFEKRRVKLLQREKTMTDKPAVTDDRFRKLIDSLERQDHMNKEM